MGIEAVDGVEHGRQGRALFGQVVLRAAAQDQHIDLVAKLGDIVLGMHRNAAVEQLHVGRVAAAEDADQLHVRALGDRHFHTLAEVAVPCDADSDFALHMKT